ncbi:MAG: NAD-dependent epimerase/dehydratase family protein [Candidatus Omnitrophica bacterium]|nr:NAD-dependent epimerase/dehydratase family protein [Candidatus Omnitrophota bacterium]
MIKGKRIFLTGGAGFIGTTLIQRLIENNTVIAYDNLLRDALTGTDLARHPNLTFIKGDVLDTEALAPAMKGAQIVVHLAAIAGVDSVLRDPITTIKVNMVGTANVLDIVSRIKGLERFVDFSTSEVFGTHAYKVDEFAPTLLGSVGEARWTYAVSKLVGEHMCHAYWRQNKVPACSIRPFNVYGPGQVGEGAIQQFVKRAVQGEDLVVRGDGSQIRAWCYVDDLIEGLLLVLEHPKAVGEVFNIGNPLSTVTIYDLARRVIDVTGAPSKIRFEPLNYTDIEIRIPNIDKARSLLGYEPKVQLEDGILRTYEWFKKQLVSEIAGA